MSAPVARIGLYLLAVLAGLVVVSAAVNAFVPSQHGPTSSSYATTPGGLAAYAELLARAGHPVAQLRRAPANGVFRPSETVVLLDPDAVLPSQGRALHAFVAAGGDLVTGGSSGDAFLPTILRPAPTLVESAPTRAGPLAAVPETAGVGRVVTLGAAGWSQSPRPAGARDALGAPGGPPLLLVARIGRGRIALLADASPLQNRLLASADNARLGVDLAGGAGRPVVFVESVHGYGVARGLAAIPSRWWWALAGLALAALAWIAARWPRLGPPSVPGRVLPPARSAYLHGMTNILRRADRPSEAAGLARLSARRLLARRTGLRLGSGSEEQLAAARRLGLTEHEARLVLDERPLRGEHLVEVGAALARLAPGAPRSGPGSADRLP
ncbi:MAG TPA: DUF4350 domain-containing protein [Solirubrobacteraceae bacterium]|jgi:hypothetical protein|nr:DUF4350 domain-containing protein [Solirubrobacteraceae bacterium]